MLFVRLFLGAAIVVATLLVAMLIGLFSGGGRGLFVLVWVGIVVTPIWALVPLCRAITGREIHNGPPNHQKLNETDDFA